MAKKSLLIIVGKSGSGKNYIASCMKLMYTKGYTTRPPRQNDDSNLLSISKSEAESFINKKLVCGETYYNGNTYFHKIEDVNNIEYDYIILSKEGLKNFINRFNEKMGVAVELNIKYNINRKVEYIYIDCPFYKRIINMRKRGDSFKDIFKRIKNDMFDFKGAKEMVISNGGKVINM